VLVSPVGELATAPLSLLLPDREVAFVPSATSRKLLRKKAGEKASAVLAVGDPRYGEGEESRKVFARLHRGSDMLFNLPESRLEVELVTPRKTDVRLLGKDATESRFREELGTRKRWRSVHFACHGLVNLENPGWSSLALTPVKNVDDGYLAVGEIVTMRIPADLAVLSACSTAVGPTMRGEGLIALPGAFHHAGTPRVLASLWKVEDKAAREMMDAFYRLWNPKDGKPGIGAALALKKAQQILRDKGYEHPRHWAAWVLWGLPD
jgi:CHAT domain-containing protein